MDRPLARRISSSPLAIGVSRGRPDGPAPGVNVAAAHRRASSAPAGSSRRPGRHPIRSTPGCPITALVLAAFVAVRADPFVALLDVARRGGVHAVRRGRVLGLAVTRRSARRRDASGVGSMEAALAGRARALRIARPVAPGRRRARPPTWLGPVGRGLLWRSRSRRSSRCCSPRPIPSSGRRRRAPRLRHRSRRPAGPGPVRRSGSPGWSAGCSGRRGRAPAGGSGASLGAAAAPTAARPRRALGTTEALVVLRRCRSWSSACSSASSSPTCSAASTRSAAAGMTYSDYARRGYFELVAAAGLAGGVLVALEYQVVRRPRPYLGLPSASSALTSSCWPRRRCASSSTRTPTAGPSCALYVAVSIVAMAVTW